MQYDLSISSENMNDILSEKHLIASFQNIHKGSHYMQKEGKLGRSEYKVENRSGVILSQWNSQFKKDVRIYGHISEPMFALHFMRSGITEYKIPGSCTIVKAGQNNLWALDAGRSSYSGFKKNTYCASYGIIFKDDYLLKLVNQYPDLLSEVYERYKKGEVFYNGEKHVETSEEMNRIILQLENASQMGTAANLYTEAKVLELLAMQLAPKTHTQTEQAKHCKTNSDIDKIHEARSILVQNMLTPPSIKELARSVGINEKKLKYGFREVYEQTVYGYLFEYKMNLAQQFLLDANKSIYEVALDCGYEYASHFSSAFKRKFGISPKQFRLNRVSPVNTVISLS